MSAWRRNGLSVQQEKGIKAHTSLMKSIGVGLRMAGQSTWVPFGGEQWTSKPTESIRAKNAM
jgi:hypothetical protein